MKTPDQIRDYVASHLNLTNDHIRSNLCRHGVNAAQINAARAALGGAKPAKTLEAEKPAPVARIRVRDLAEFRRQHDIPQKIRERLANMRGYLTEDELRQLCDVPVQHWRRNAELPEFAEHKFKHDGVVYWASKATIKEMKQITGRA